MVDENGNENHVNVEREKFFKGRVFGEIKSEVGLHVDDDGVMLGSIYLPDETYHVEPSWRHLDNFDNRTMITYRESDVKLNLDETELNSGLKTCGYVAQDNNHSKVVNDSSRSKREIYLDNKDFTRSRCPLLLVADYRFYREMGGGNSRTTINYLVNIISVIIHKFSLNFQQISLIDRVHKMYSETTWQDKPDAPGLSDFGFVIKKIIVHSSPTYMYGANEHYNMQRNEWDVRRLLEVSHICSIPQ